MKRRQRPLSNPGDDLGGRIVADLLDLPQDSDLFQNPESFVIGETIVRRIGHLEPEAACVVLAQSLGIFLGVVHQIRQDSDTGANVIQEARDGLTAMIVAGAWPTERGN
ncbi:hypothetical protein [Microbacterium sp. NPDC089696]|uniref:hypothetical protein n=1 Tax=Microbacterium sp. NPDC089696 TaxID=3364199 RepID=UPI0037F71FC1